jgi:PEP-CTERM motif
MSKSSLRATLTAFAIGAGVVLGASGAQAATIIWNLNSPPGVPSPNPDTQTFTAGGITISANGFTNGNFSGPPNLALFVKTDGGDETGLGSNVDASGDHELNGTQWIQIDFRNARMAGVTDFDFMMGSTTGEAWRVFGSNSATSLGSQILTGTDELEHDLTGANGAFAFYNFQATAGNVLVASVSGAVPEPATWAMMLLGFAGLGFAFRQSRRKVSFA